ncbi:ABC transporter ATP-binding protein [Treponema parvum]|uniref:ABC transporter ATP-binding protein n=1 Tax=Treponema parvum TaxID=138851 RepID=UPI001AEBC4E8|nr:ABC transporter ATP-binding protein [Treponema parvum]QTQ16463.1 ABC transporter ATP-binding protein [Treponema parvum]
MDVTITIKHALKKYEDNRVVIPDLNLVINAREFFTLLGPSGCGKTTLLRMIAGFNSIEGGEFYFNENLINNLEPAKRNIGMVFQNYAIFPHMSVEKNISFALKNKKISPADIEKITTRFLDLMQITEYRHRMPDKLSGGQQQRVALARALAISPDVLLMDEPLSNLDAKLRLDMRKAIKDIQNKVGITTVYVTHDQEEAMAISDRIAVMNAGVIQQIGTPRQLYQRPENLFVANFIGRTNILKGKAEGQHISFPGGYRVRLDNLNPCAEQNVQIAVRPEEFIICRGTEQNGIGGVVEDRSFLGLNTHYFIRLDSGELVESIRESLVGKDLAKGERIKLQVKTEKINVFTQDEKAVTLIKGEIPDNEEEV